MLQIRQVYDPAVKQIDDGYCWTEDGERYDDLAMLQAFIASVKVGLHKTIQNYYLCDMFGSTPFLLIDHQL